MKLTLIKPNIGRREDRAYVDEGRMEPLQLGVLAAIAPPDVEVALYDDRIETIPFDEPTDLAAITVETYTARRAYEISAAYRARGVPVIMGGFHATLATDECALHADSVYVGDAEYHWAEAIEDARRGTLRPRYVAPVGVAHPGMLTRRALFAGKGYLPLTLMQFNRGCLYRCRFCAVSEYFKARCYRRDVGEVLREIEAQDRRFIFFVDDNIAADHEALKELCRALVPMRIRWVSQASIDMADDPELLDLMMASGCLGNVVGFESLDRRALRSMRKSPNLVRFDQYRRQLATLRSRGMQLWASFTLGHDFDTEQSVADTLDFALDNKFCFAAFNILMPYPGTPLYRDLAAEGRLLYDGRWWLHPDYRFNYASFTPKLMSPGQLTDACLRARCVFNSPLSIVRRAFDFRTNMSSPHRLGLYLQFNPLFRREVFKKHGMRFGYT